MYAQPAGAAFRASLASIANTRGAVTESDRAVLHERICVAVDELKAMGWTVERIIVRLTQVASEVGLRPADANHREAVWDDVIKRCIDHYYGPRPPSEAKAAQPRHLT